MWTNWASCQGFGAREGRTQMQNFKIKKVYSKNHKAKQKSAAEPDIKNLKRWEQNKTMKRDFDTNKTMSNMKLWDKQDYDDEDYGGKNLT